MCTDEPDDGGHHAVYEAHQLRTLQLRPQERAARRTGSCVTALAMRKYTLQKILPALWRSYPAGLVFALDEVPGMALLE